MAAYSYIDDTGLVIQSAKKDYDQKLYELREGISLQADEQRLSLDEIRREDEQFELDAILYEEDELGDVFRYRIDEENRSVYLFDHHSGSLLIGDSAMASSASEWIESDFLGGKILDEDSWHPDLNV